VPDCREYYQTGENVIDGTKCSYDNPDNICVQGKCIQLGCDKVTKLGANVVILLILLQKIGLEIDNSDSKY
jgi:hypothetical protein